MYTPQNVSIHSYKATVYYSNPKLKTVLSTSTETGLQLHAAVWNELANTGLARRTYSLKHICRTIPVLQQAGET
jgi:hypothetical protein